MGIYGDQVLPRVMNVLLSDEESGRVRERVAAGLSGEVLEIGFGSGLNVPYYPAQVRRVRAVDPATVGRKLAEKRVAATAIPIEYVGLDGAALPLDAASVDHVLVTWTLCTIPDVGTALREIHRVLRPGGRLHFAEHGRSPDVSVARWQDRLNPVQRTWAGGCNLNRPIDRLIESAGFELEKMDTYTMSGPRILNYTYEGRAVRA
ncbi:MAG TPA: class I SAM-dependent methyltransferase [Acidimicrobiales bacterium]|nr:class I SAM-dependent methyltransferase [Acidimicrobiales bacterium]